MEQETFEAELNKYRVVRNKDYTTQEHIKPASFAPPQPRTPSSSSSSSSSSPSSSSAAAAGNKTPVRTVTYSSSSSTSSSSSSSSSASSSSSSGKSTSVESEPGPEISVTIKPLKGDEFSLKIACSETVYALKLAAESKCSIPAGQQRLVLKGKALVDSNSLAAAGLVEGCKLHLFIKAESSSAPASPSTAVASPSATPQHVAVIAAPSSPAPPTGPVQDIILALTRFLEQRRTLTPEQIGATVRTFKKDCAGFLSSLSLDDIERFASSINASHSKV
ncbi:hypothetical protein CAOG_04037 [Capsaspora owczarzaki ATCC 30864]|uniref:Ubiquitin-like domain-containing protein n=1 Tax=Capsaspora owczarzaki (strain ATCC 30864) TaxID=595528 RepID=A0A0D2WQJ7_CAPO3|nr:hypothetical protein CAOG_04037 [Capsaspora owczarzaki ATCC 30864]KJE93218.1 hypothetical protein CAOG_004037 [Capsaspora owczarzaki ATCC 30864]|eukprot:XP_004347862.1 hypothetical protein CAOG_04037 [Capsaspora owczarzaki ATCC 30864]